MKLRYAIASTLLIASSNCLAEPYFFFGAGLGSSSHDLTNTSYPILDLKLGGGYRFPGGFATELDLGGVSTSSKSGTGTCTTTMSTVVPCKQTNEVRRQLIAVSGIYETTVGSYGVFGKAGVALISSGYLSTVESDYFATATLVDESATNAAGIVSAGMIFNDAHRVSAVATSKYGNAGTGKFGYAGLEYNYRIKF